MACIKLNLLFELFGTLGKLPLSHVSECHDARAKSKARRKTRRLSLEQESVFATLYGLHRIFLATLCFLADQWHQEFAADRPIKC